MTEREYGDDCVACFDAGETPEFIYVMFEGIKLGDIPNSFPVPNGVLFKCVQKEGVPCRWEYNFGGPGWVVYVYRSAETGNWHVTLSIWAGNSHFTGFNAGCPSEHDIFTNVYWAPIWWSGWDGVASIFWMEAALELIAALNLPTENTFMEYFLIDELKPVYKFCNVKYGINHTIAIE